MRHPQWISEKIIVKEIIRSQGKERVYYLFVPDKIDSATPAPLLVLLHGSGRNGMSLVEKWKDLAKKEGIIIAGPDAIDSFLKDRIWRMGGMETSWDNFKNDV